MAKRKGRVQKGRGTGSAYFTQPGRRGAIIVLRKPIGNRATPKVCGTMPSRDHARMLIAQLEKAESVVKDLFMEATDDGIEALEAILAACRDEVLRKGPKGPGRGAPAGRAPTTPQELDSGGNPEVEDDPASVAEESPPD